MSEEVVQGLGVLTRALEIVGAGALVLGFVITTARCFRRSLRKGAILAVDRYRQSLGRVGGELVPLRPGRLRIH